MSHGQVPQKPKRERAGSSSPADGPVKAEVVEVDIDEDDDATLGLDEVGDGALDGDDVELDGRSSRLPAVVGNRLPDTLSALNVYLGRLKDVEILPIEEQSRLAAEFQDTGNPDAAARLVASNLRLVVKIAFQFRRQWADVMDLIAEGNVGLAEAIRKFDVERGIPFPSYARFWIRARILAFIQENKHLIHAGSRAARKLFWRLERERRKLVQEGFDPTPKRLAAAVGVKTEDVNELAPILDHRPVSLDTPMRGDEDGRSRGETLADERSGDPEDIYGAEQLHDQLQLAFRRFRDTLDERDQAIWDQRLQAEDPVRLEDLGDEYGISKERVRQLEVRIKQRLKKFLETYVDQDVIVEALR